MSKKNSWSVVKNKYQNEVELIHFDNLYTGASMVRFDFLNLASIHWFSNTSNHNNFIDNCDEIKKFIELNFKEYELIMDSGTLSDGKNWVEFKIKTIN